MHEHLVVEETVHRIKEAVAPLTHIYWNPLDNSGEVQFFVQDMCTENGGYVGLVPHKTVHECTNGMPLKISLANLIERSVSIVPVEGMEPIVLSGGLIMLAVKQVFRDVFAERLTEQAAEPA